MILFVVAWCGENRPNMQQQHKLMLHRDYSVIPGWRPLRISEERRLHEIIFVMMINYVAA